VEGSPALTGRLLRYVQAFHAQVALTAACNGRHRIERRLARWLLMTHDRTDGDDLPLTQEFISMMLGVRRPGVTAAAGALRKAGLIRPARGGVRVLDRPGLEAAACDCYREARGEHERLLGPVAPR
jgi:CRP-like cAMP-binding protein